MALRHALAVAAGAIELAEIVNREAGDRKGAATVVLEDFVLGAKGTAASDFSCFAVGLILDRKGVLADC